MVAMCMGFHNPRPSQELSGGDARCELRRRRGLVSLCREAGKAKSGIKNLWQKRCGGMVKSTRLKTNPTQTRAAAAKELIEQTATEASYQLNMLLAHAKRAGELYSKDVAKREGTLQA